MKNKIANIFGSFGYMSLAVQWIWMAITLGYPLIASDVFETVVTPDCATPNVVANTAPVINLPQPVAIAIGAITLVLIFGATIYAIATAPRNIGKAGKKITNKSAEISAKVIIPQITHHHKISKKRQKTLLERITWAVKFTLIMIPTAALLIPTSQHLGLPYNIVVVVGLACTVFTIFWFGCQFAIAKLGKIDAKDIW